MSVVGGVEQVAASLANALTEKYNVHLISLCLMNGDKSAYALNEKVIFKNLLEKDSRLLDMRKKAKKVLKDYFEKNNIDTALILGNYPGFICSGVKTKAKLVFCDHGALMNQWHQKDIVVLRFVASLQCDRVVTLTKQSHDDYLRKFHLSKKKVSYIYNWIDTDVPHSESYDVTSKKIISAGRFGKEKGFENLAKAFALVSQKHPDWSLDIYGDGEMMEEVRRVVVEEKLEGKLNLPGMVSDLASKYKEYAMYVLPSYREGMPLVLLEAKLNKLPIVSYDIMTGPREIIRDGVDGILVPPQDIEKMAESICKLIENEELRKSMSEKTYENLGEFSKKEILAKWIELIEEKK